MYEGFGLSGGQILQKRRYDQVVMRTVREQRGVFDVSERAGR